MERKKGDSNMMRYDNLIMPDKARKAAATLKQYCEQNGCMYCVFRNKSPEFCQLSDVPRNYPAEALLPNEGGMNHA